MMASIEFRPGCEPHGMQITRRQMADDIGRQARIRHKWATAGIRPPFRLNRRRATVASGALRMS